MVKGGVSGIACCLCTLAFLYTIGGFLFSWFEREAELLHYKKNAFFYNQMQELYSWDHCKDKFFADMELCKNQQAFHEVLEKFFERNGNEMKDQEKWTLFGSVFFVSTLLSTVGYGQMHPRTEGGQVFTVIFGLLGIPIMGYILSQIGQQVVGGLMPMFPTIKAQNRQILVLSIAVILFILVGGVVFILLEGWSYLEALYFSACTLMTIGFGDYLPSHVGSKLFTMFFILMGLGVGASFIAVLTLHVHEQGEHFAQNLNSWYDSTSRNCCGDVSSEDQRIAPQDGRMVAGPGRQ